MVLVHSSAQLLEPFRLSHDIQLVSGGAGILSGSAGVADLDRAPGAPATGIVPGTLAVGPTTELEDPPGLYEKVRALSRTGLPEEESTSHTQDRVTGEDIS